MQHMWNIIEVLVKDCEDVNWMGCGQVNKILDFWLYER
jgi:hypothetical protein